MLEREGRQTGKAGSVRVGVFLAVRSPCLVKTRAPKVVSAAAVAARPARIDTEASIAGVSLGVMEKKKK